MIADYDGDISRLFDDGIDGDLPILVTRNLVLFPGVVTPILIGRTASVNLVKRLQEQQDAIFAVFSQKDSNVENPEKEDIYDYGVYAKVIRVLELPGPGNNLSRSGSGTL